MPKLLDTFVAERGRRPRPGRRAGGIDLGRAGRPGRAAHATCSPAPAWPRRHVRRDGGQPPGGVRGVLGGRPPGDDLRAGQLALDRRRAGLRARRRRLQGARGGRAVRRRRRGRAGRRAGCDRRAGAGHRRREDRGAVQLRGGARRGAHRRARRRPVRRADVLHVGHDRPTQGRPRARSPAAPTCPARCSSSSPRPWCPTSCRCPARTLLAGPVYHSAQWAFSFLPMVAGSAVVMRHQFDPAETVRLIDECAITNVHLVPVQFKRLLDLPDEVRARPRRVQPRGGLARRRPLPGAVEAGDDRLARARRSTSTTARPRAPSSRRIRADEWLAQGRQRRPAAGDHGGERPRRRRRPAGARRARPGTL